MTNSERIQETAALSAARRSLVNAIAMTIVTTAGMMTASAPSTAQTPIVIQFSHVVTPETAKGRAALRFKELAEAKTRGKVRVEVYPNSQLYKDREEMDALRLGAVQMIAPSLSKLASLGGADFEVFDLPFLFTDRAAFRIAVDGPLGASLLKKLEPSGVIGLAFWDNGFKVFTANRSLQVPADFKGQRIRVQASKVLVTQMKYLGAVPSVSPLSNVYDSLKRDQLDGQENTPINIYTQRLHEVQRHMTVSNHGYLAYAVIVNKQFWGKLPADIRNALEDALREATAFEFSLSEAENQKALEQIKASGKLSVYALSVQEAAQWRTALMPVYQAARGSISTETWKALKLPDSAPP
jgi:C4-dicarboxylate-binding protein DctP